MALCPHCMRPADAEHGRCPRCGGDLGWTGAESHLPVGTVLPGSGGLRAYQIGAARGQGGFGVTYIALETGSRRRVAVKEYFPTRCACRGGDRMAVLPMAGQDAAFQGGLHSFLEEARLLAAHDGLPTVVRVMDYFQANQTAYLVMEYLDGVPLHEKMARQGGRLPAREFVSKLPPLLRDLGRLHQGGVIHRDISPDNLMWMPDGSLKLLDFGCARSMENGKSMTVLLKHGFAPIEQYRTRGQGPYTDVYALAATVYYCVTGQVPPSAVDRLEQDTVQSPIALGADLTVRQETALLWALSVQPKARPQSMEEFAAMLFAPEEAAGPEPEPLPGREAAPAHAPVGEGGPEAASVRPLGRAALEWIARHRRALAAAGAALLVLLAVFLAGRALRAGGERPPAHCPDRLEHSLEDDGALCGRLGAARHSGGKGWNGPLFTEDT